ncbi:hypothetical protein G7046_g3313 [Stylonectria norvegica]|nr:hypothetical protein G7046_g3313 [Stylonectria norvegica]
MKSLPLLPFRRRNPVHVPTKLSHRNRRSLPKPLDLSIVNVKPRQYYWPAPVSRDSDSISPFVLDPETPDASNETVIFTPPSAEARVSQWQDLVSPRYGTFTTTQARERPVTPYPWPRTPLGMEWWDDLVLFLTGLAFVLFMLMFICGTFVVVSSWMRKIPVPTSHYMREFDRM